MAGDLSVSDVIHYEVLRLGDALACKGRLNCDVEIQQVLHRSIKIEFPLHFVGDIDLVLVPRNTTEYSGAMKGFVLLRLNLYCTLLIIPLAIWPFLSRQGCLRSWGVQVR